MASITHSRSESRAAAAKTSLGLAARLLPASLSLAAGAVHLAMSPIHAPGSSTEAIGFAVVGWAQIVLAFALLVRPSREVLVGTILLNTAVIIGYIVSRTVGLPLGETPGVAEPVKTIDLMTTIFEAALVACAALLLARPDLAEVESGSKGLSFEAIAVAAAIPLLILAVTSVELSDPTVSQHSHGDAGSGLVSTAGGHTHGSGGGTTDAAALAAVAKSRCDLGINPASYWQETTLAGIDTVTGGENPGTVGAIQGSPELDKLIGLHTTVKGEIGDAQMVLALAKVNDEVYDNWLRWLGASGKANHTHGATTTTATTSASATTGSAAAPDDTGMGGHLGPQPWTAMTNKSDCQQLESELAEARDTALKYPTVKDAKAAGWRQVTPYVPGIAAHFMNFSLVDDKFEIDKPEMILYDGTDDSSHVIGLSYYILHQGDAEPTQGFTGPNDHFHRHIGLCTNATGVIGDSTTTEEQCTAMGGHKANGGNGWMNHVWIVPGCESPWGMFSGASPVLDGDLSKNASEGPSCAGSGTRARYNLEPGERTTCPHRPEARSRSRAETSAPFRYNRSSRRPARAASRFATTRALSRRHASPA